MADARQPGRGEGAVGSPKLGELVERVETSRAEIKRLERQIEEDREAINADIERLFPNGRRGLSPRQNEVLQLVRQGKCNKEIASALNISVRTVKFHMSSLLATFGKTSRHDLMDLTDVAEKIGEAER